MSDSDLSALHADLVRGDRLPSEVLEHFLQVIEEKNPSVNALVYADADHAREQAATLDASTDLPTILSGLPTADKDLVQRRGMPTGYGTTVTSPDPSDSSDPMADWVDGVGALSVGKTSTSEFGLSAATEAHATGPTRTPHDSSRTA